jgi:predicted MFS family arabinose efflux permease
MFGLFLVLPVFSLLAQQLEGATPLLIGIAFGGYGLTQALLQIPFGMWSDRIGRKPVIMAGLLLFILGSLIAAYADNIYLMIVARLLQGAGAISSAVFALIADLTRPEVRTRANAGIGASIGMAFGCAFFIAPFLGSSAGLSGIFGVITVMATIGLFILWRLVPEPKVSSRSTSSLSLDTIKSIVVLPSIRTIDFGAFVCSTGLSAVFFMIPIQLAEHGWKSEELWQIYLPMLLSGGLIMVGAAIVAETKNRFREVMFGGVSFLIASVLCLGFFLENQNDFWLIAGLFLFFMGFNVFEPLFPSLVTRLTNPANKGTASGVYNFCQFVGHFAGAAIAGVLYSSNMMSLLGVLLSINLVFLFLLYRDFPNPAAPQKAVS